MARTAPLAGLAAALLVLTSCSSTPEASLEPDALLDVLCGLHEQQRDLSGYELASEDDENALWRAQVVLSTRLPPEIEEAIDHADFAVRELIVGNEPTEENVEEGRAVVDEACEDADPVEPDADLYVDLACLMDEEPSDVGPRGTTTLLVSSQVLDGTFDEDATDEAIDGLVAELCSPD